MLTAPARLLAGVALDLALGDPQWLPHPVRALGWAAHRAEAVLRRQPVPPRFAGFLYWLVLVTPFTASVWLTSRLWRGIPGIYWVYAFLACRDLDFEAGRVIHALAGNQPAEARRWLSFIVGRDTATLNETEMLRATLETVAENLSDGVVAPLFYLAFAGPAGMAAYKAINTLDSMVGYRNERYAEFGWASARIDDIANFLPARLTAMLIWVAALLPGFSAQRSFRITLRDGASQPSPNSGFPEAAAAGALGVQLGGTNTYRGVPSHKPRLGDSVRPLERALFGRVRVLLYATEALCVALLLGVSRWR